MVFIAHKYYGQVWPTKEIAEVAAIAVRHVLADPDQKGSVEVASIAAFNAVCRYVELEADDTLVATPAAASSNGTLLAVPPTPHPYEKLLFSEINQKRVTENYKDGIIADFESMELHCSCNQQITQANIHNNLKRHLKSKGHQKYETDRLNDTERKRLKNMHDTYFQKFESYKNTYCLDGINTCQKCYQIVSEVNGGEKKHASK